MGYVRISDRKTHHELYYLGDASKYQRAYYKKHKEALREYHKAYKEKKVRAWEIEYEYEGSDPYHIIRRRERERMMSPEPKYKVDEEAFFRVISELDSQLNENPENQLLINRLKNQVR